MRPAEIVGDDARVARDPDRDGEFAGFLGARRDQAHVSTSARPASVKKRGHVVAGEAEPAMGEVFAQGFLVVGGEIDQQQPTARPERARRLAYRARGLVEEVQHLMDDDQVVGVALDGRRVDVALAQQQLRRPLSSMRARARASIAGLWSTPTARSASGAISSSMRPEPVPRSSSAWMRRLPMRSRIAASTRSSGACRARMWSQSAARSAK